VARAFSLDLIRFPRRLVAQGNRSVVESRTPRHITAIRTLPSTVKFAFTHAAKAEILAYRRSFADCGLQAPR
jgi:hypothetical protein